MNYTRFDQRPEEAPDRLGMFREFVYLNKDDLWSPTPLDPYATFIPNTEDIVPYISWMHDHLSQRIDDLSEAAGVDEPTKYKMLHELNAALDVRVDRNTKAYERLKDHLINTPVDPTMHDIILRARSGMAHIPELARLIKEHPEMISLEFFMRHVLLDSKEYAEASTRLNQQLMLLQSNFADAEVTLNLENQDHPKRGFITESGAYVTKEVVGTVASRDSRTDIVVKRSWLLLPTSINLKGAPQNIVNLSDSLTVNAQPLSISAYFRTSDYKQREGYSEPTDEHRLDMTPDALRTIGALGNLATDDARHEVATSIADEQMREVYLRFANPNKSSN